MFSEAGRDLSGWAPLRALVKTLFERPEMRHADATIQYDRQMPETGMGSAIDLKAGTSVLWNGVHEDDLDHFFEVRRLERQAPAWRALMPSAMDGSGWSDADCWITIAQGRIRAIANGDNGESTDSTVTIDQTLGEGGWTTRVEISFAADMPDSDVLVLKGHAIDDMVLAHNRAADAMHRVGHRYVEGEMTVIYTPDVLKDLDG